MNAFEWKGPAQWRYSDPVSFITTGNLITSQLKDCKKMGFSALTLITVLLCISQSISSDADVMSDFLHLNNFGRYASCPFHDLHFHEFACFIQDQRKVNQIIHNTPGSAADLKRQLPRLANQTILFVGDSLVANQFVSLACLLWEADLTITDNNLYFRENQLQREKMHTEVTGHRDGHALRTVAIHSNVYDLEVQYLYTGTLLNVYETQLGRINNITIAKEVLDFEWQALLEGRFEPVLRTPTIIMLSAGHHFDTFKYIPAISHTVGTNGFISKNGSNGDNKRIKTRQLSEFTRIDPALMELVFDQVNTELKKIMHGRNKKFRVIMRTVPPRHYSRGEWNTGGTCNDELPLSQTHMERKLELGDEHYTVPLMFQSVINASAERWGVEFLDILPYALTRSDAMVGSTPVGLHGGVNDCSHYCVPGVPDMWNSLLIDQILQK